MAARNPRKRRGSKDPDSQNPARRRNLGDAKTHDNTNLPILVAGGGFRHGSHLAFPHDDNLPLSNLFVTVLERLGIEVDAFGSSTGPLTGLGSV